MGHQYVSGKSRSAHKPHSTKSEEITELFIKAGWIGRRRKRLPVLKAVPFFDKGPGLGR